MNRSLRSFYVFPDKLYSTWKRMRLIWRHVKGNSASMNEIFCKNEESACFSRSLRMYHILGSHPAWTLRTRKSLSVSKIFDQVTFCVQCRTNKQLKVICTKSTNGDRKSVVYEKGLRMVDTSTVRICRISPMYSRTPVIARKGRQSTECVVNGRGSVLRYSSVICFCHSRLIPTSFTQIHFSAQQRMKPNNYILNVYSLKYASVYLFLNNACTHYRYYANPTSKCVAYVSP